MSGDDQEWVTVRLVYTGRRLSRKGTLHETFVFANDPDADVWLKGKPKFAAIGRTYEMETYGSAFRVYGATWLKDVDRHALTEEWAAQDRAAYLAHQAIQTRKRLEKDSKSINGLTLAELRREMELAGPAQRAGLLAAILQELKV